MIAKAPEEHKCTEKIYSPESSNSVIRLNLPVSDQRAMFVHASKEEEPAAKLNATAFL